MMYESNLYSKYNKIFYSHIYETDLENLDLLKSYMLSYDVKECIDKTIPKQTEAPIPEAPTPEAPIREVPIPEAPIPASKIQKIEIPNIYYPPKENSLFWSIYIAVNGYSAFINCFSSSYLISLQMEFIIQKI